MASESEASLRIVSGDGHVVEPYDLWTTRLAGGPFADRAPHMTGDAQGGYVFHIDGLEPFPIGLTGAAGRPDETLTVEGELRRGGWDAAARLEDMDADGVDSEVLYPSVGMIIAQSRDRDYQLAVIQAYNDWLVDFCAKGEGRLAGIALVPASDPEQSVEEVRRAHAAGLRGVMVPAVPVEGHFAESRWDPLWAAVAERELPVSFHLFTGGEHGDATLGSGLRILAHMESVYHMQLTIGLLIWGKVFDRHPELRIVSGEHDGGWVAHYAYRCDQVFERHHNWLMAGASLDRQPSEYMRQNIWYTFQKDPVAVETRERVGVTQLMWASDYPHSDSTWPHSRQVIERDFKGVPRDELARMVGGNAAALYGLE